MQGRVGIVMTLQDEVRYLYEHPKGKIDDLLQHVGKKTVEEMELIGIIHRGKEADGTDSYNFARTGKEIFALITHDENYKPTFSERLQAFVSKHL
jgi:hypothetical protein